MLRRLAALPVRWKPVTSVALTRPSSSAAVCFRPGCVLSQSSRRPFATKHQHIFLCTDCGFETPKWSGQCPSCKEWDTLKKFAPPEGSASSGSASASAGSSHPRAAGWFSAVNAGDASSSNLVPLVDVELGPQPRIPLPQSPELERLLGGGLTRGSFTLLGGPPGVGKSTLLLQAASWLCESAGNKVAYVCGEETAQQVKARAERLGVTSPLLYILTEVQLDDALEQLAKNGPFAAVIVDSIQTCHTSSASGAAGHPGQVRASAMQLMNFAKATQSPVLVTCHQNKAGDLAGPRLLEHIVDTVLSIESGGDLVHRVVRCTKNRFGSSYEMGVFEMTGTGLKDVDSLSDLFLQQYGDHAPTVTGAAVACVLEGSRPLAVEVQALVTGSRFDSRHRASGIGLDRLVMLAAVVGNTRGHSAFRSKEAILNIAGGLKVSDPAVDLAVAMALVSSFKKHPVPRDVAFVGEVGLTGEVRQVPLLDQRVAALKQHGFRRCLVPGSAAGSVKRSGGVDLVPVRTLEDAIEAGLET